LNAAAVVAEEKKIRVSKRKSRANMIQTKEDLEKMYSTSSNSNISVGSSSQSFMSKEEITMVGQTSSVKNCRFLQKIFRIFLS
jgi:hypothetical protein